MKKLGLIALAVMGLLALPGTALGTHEGQWTECPDGTAYVDTDGAAGSSDKADTAAGACVHDLGVSVASVNTDGALVEAGTGGGGGYAVVDGHSGNSDPVFNASSGYYGVSNYERDDRSRDADCDGSAEASPSINSGGCLYIKGIGGVPGVPVMCGNMDGGSRWDDTRNDGCVVIDWGF